jgi:hypothetical protein
MRRKRPVSLDCMPCARGLTCTYLRKWVYCGFREPVTDASILCFFLWRNGCGRTAELRDKLPVVDWRLQNKHWPLPRLYLKGRPLAYNVPSLMGVSLWS